MISVKLNSSVEGEVAPTVSSVMFQGPSPSKVTSAKNRCAVANNSLLQIKQLTVWKGQLQMLNLMFGPSKHCALLSELYAVFTRLGNRHNQGVVNIRKRCVKP